MVQRDAIGVIKNDRTTLGEWRREEKNTRLHPEAREVRLDKTFKVVHTPRLQIVWYNIYTHLYTYPQLLYT